MKVIIRTPFERKSYAYVALSKPALEKIIEKLRIDETDEYAMAISRGLYQSYIKYRQHVEVLKDE